MSRTERDLPSIDTPLANESKVATVVTRTTIDPGGDNGAAAQTTTEPNPRLALKPLEPTPPDPATSEAHTPESADAHRRHEPQPEGSPKPGPAADQAAGELLDKRVDRVWPRRRHRNLATPELANVQAEGGHHYGWEP